MMEKERTGGDGKSRCGGVRVDVSHHKSRWENWFFGCLTWWLKIQEKGKKWCRGWGAKEAEFRSSRRERERDGSKTKEAKVVFCSVIRGALTPGRHWGCFCSPLELLVVYLHSWLRDGREQGGNKTKCASWRQRSEGFGGSCFSRKYAHTCGVCLLLCSAITRRQLCIICALYYYVSAWLYLEPFMPHRSHYISVAQMFD